MVRASAGDGWHPVKMEQGQGEGKRPSSGVDAGIVLGRGV